MIRSTRNQTARRILEPAPALQVRQLTVRFGGLTAVDVDEILIRRGRIVGLIGANGAGKTTMFDAISGFVEPTAGSIVLHGSDRIDGQSPTQRARLGLGRSFQNAVLFESLTVAETIAVACERSMAGAGPLASSLKLPWARRREQAVSSRVEELIEVMGLGAFRDKFIAELSTGSRRIVDLACIIAHRPSVLLLDEPSSGIAQREVESLKELLFRVREWLDCTMIVVEHDIPLIRSMADEIYAMEVGSVISHGTPDEVLSDPQVIRSYLGSDPRAVERSGSARKEDIPARTSKPQEETVES